MNEKLIIRGCKQGDRKAQRAFVDEYSKYLFSICMRYMIDTPKAQDALQESLMHILTKIDKFDDNGAFKSWITTVTIRKNLEILRKDKVRKTSDIEAIAEPSTPFETDLKLEKDDVFKFISQLPENYRVAINMYLVEGYSHKEVGQALGISEGTSRSLVSRGRQMIKEAFREDNVKNMKQKPKAKNLRIAF